jgi:hypothetical protein
VSPRWSVPGYLRRLKRVGAKEEFVDFMRGELGLPEAHTHATDPRLYFCQCRWGGIDWRHCIQIGATGE